jgi:hypothetical protein
MKPLSMQYMHMCKVCSMHKHYTHTSHILHNSILLLHSQECISNINICVLKIKI